MSIGVGEFIVNGEVAALQSDQILSLSGTPIIAVLTAVQAVAQEALSPDSPRCAAGGSCNRHRSVENIEGLSPAQMAALVTIGVSAIEISRSEYIALTALQAAALSDTGISLIRSNGEPVSLAVTGTAAHVEAWTPVEITALIADGLSSMTATDGPVILSVAQAVAYEGANPPGSLGIIAPVNTAVEVVDTAAHIEALTPTQLEHLCVDPIVATDASIVFTVAQAEAATPFSNVEAPRGDRRRLPISPPISTRLPRKRSTVSQISRA